MSKLTPEKREAIVAAYLRGDKTLVIQKEQGIVPGELYRVLRDAKVQLRSRDPNHPASSKTTRKAAAGEAPTQLQMSETSEPTPCIRRRWPCRTPARLPSH